MTDAGSPCAKRIVARGASRPSPTQTAELERFAVPRFRILGILGCVMAAIITTVLELVRHDLVALPGVSLHWAGPIALAIGSLAMILVTTRRWPARRVIVFGLAFQIFGAACCAYIEQGLSGVKGASMACIWILNFALVPTTPRRAAVAAYGAAATVPLVTLAMMGIAGAPAPDGFELLRCLLTFVVATIAVVTARVIYGLNCEVADAKKLGAYELVEPLGSGGMGDVWRAEHRTLVRPAAIKLMRHELTANLGRKEREGLNRRFRREVQATAMLTSPHTVAVYDFGQTSEGELYYVMELLHGLDVERLVTTYGPQPAERVVHLLRQACASLGEAHRRDLVHRDIKPANIYLCAVGTEVDFVKVLDFGLVHGIDRELKLTAEGTVSGTPAYLPPETAARNLCDARSDIYALGCVAYWLLTGTLVFEAETSAAMMAAHIHDRPVPPSRRTELAIPPELEAVVLACLAKNPADRPQSAEELDALLAGVPVDAWTRDDAETWWRVHVPQTLARAWRGHESRPRVPARRPSIRIGDEFRPSLAITAPARP